jgi:hypothetical protein
MAGRVGLGKDSNVMSDTAAVFDAEELEVLSYDVSDDALENAAGKEMVVVLTVAFCTGLDSCPA